jgi:hypothetical protein
MFKHNRDRIRLIKIENEQSRAMIDLIQSIVDRERTKENTPEIIEKLNQMEMNIGVHRILIADNEALIAKLEHPFLTFWKWAF